MKKILPWFSPEICLAILICCIVFSCDEKQNHRVFVFTDINLIGGDPDDRQSLVHLYWYANELEIEGIVLDYWKGQSQEACQEVLDAYNKKTLETERQELYKK